MKNLLKKRNDFILALCVIAYVLLQAFIVVSHDIKLEAFNGVFMACQFGICLVMLMVNKRRGAKISLVLMTISFALLLKATFDKKGNTLPGVFNSVIYIVTYICLFRQFMIREKEAKTDLPTGVLNIRGLDRLLKDKVRNDKPFSIVYIEIENYKNLNNNFGHSYGDELLMEIIKRIRSVIGKSGDIARINGSEFVAVLYDCENLAKKANEILKAIREKTSIEVNNHPVEGYITPYAAIASFPKDGDSADLIIKKADIALVKAVGEKIKTVSVFDETMESSLLREFEVANYIRDALKSDYFYLVYQPQYNISHRRLRGFEALLRMKTSEGVLISPGEFIPIAEKQNMILEIDDYVIRRAIREFKDIVAERPELIVSVNISAKNICDESFADRIEKLLAETRFPAKNFEIEITEYCLVDSIDTTIENIKKLRNLGVEFALDDFGTGYTSLSYLAKLPINLLKIDKSLVDDIVSNQKSKEFVQAVISMGHMMGCEVISEGVETEEQLEILGAESCDLVQGYVWGRPLEYEVAKNLEMKI